MLPLGLSGSRDQAGSDLPSRKALASTSSVGRGWLGVLKFQSSAGILSNLEVVNFAVVQGGCRGRVGEGGGGVL